MGPCSTCHEDRCVCLDTKSVEAASGILTRPGATAEDYAAATDNGIILTKPKQRFKLTLKATHPQSHVSSKTGAAVYVYGEEFDDHILITADVDPDSILEIERAGEYDPSTNRILNDPEPSSMDDKQISA
jgi:hypothetical protein